MKSVKISASLTPRAESFFRKRLRIHPACSNPWLLSLV
jgi:hypothetical protein